MVIRISLPVNCHLARDQDLLLMVADDTDSYYIYFSFDGRCHEKRFTSGKTENNSQAVFINAFKTTHIASEVEPQ